MDGTNTFSGKGEGNTSPVDFSGGHYSVSYDYQGRLLPRRLPEADQGALAGSHSLPSGMGALHGTDNVYGVVPGTYYVEMISGPPPDCPWQIVLTGAP